METVKEWIEQLAIDNHVIIQQEFIRKRDEIKQKLYSRNENCPDSFSISGTSVPFPPNVRKGKTMLKKVNGSMHQRFGKVVDLCQVTLHLKCEELEKIHETLLEPT